MQLLEPDIRGMNVVFVPKRMLDARLTWVLLMAEKTWKERALL
jgi:hypothetical protein